MKPNPTLNLFFAAASLVSMSGCASIMSGSRKNITINSNPPGAHVSVADKNGAEVASLTTPCVANLKRGAGYFSGASYVAKIEKPGYQSQEVKIQATANPWTLGNIVFGGVIGLLIVDPVTGGMFMLTPAEIEAQLQPVKKP
jgi:hypothetical protein